MGYRMWRVLLAMLAAIGVLFAFGVTGAAAAPSFGSTHPVQQYDANQWPLLVVDDQTSQNPNYFHIRDQGFLAWGENPTGTENGHQLIEWSNAFSYWANRVEVTVTEQQLDNYNCSGTSGPGLAGCTETTAYWQPNLNDYRVTKAFIHLDVDLRPRSSALRLQVAKHEIGHVYGLVHCAQGAGIMEPTEDGGFPNPTSAESSAVYQRYHGGVAGGHLLAIPNGTPHPVLRMVYPEVLPH